MSVLHLPVDIWAIISRCVTPREWAKACSTCHTMYALRRVLVAIEVCSMLSEDRQDLARQLQLHRWPGCQSLCLNLRQLDPLIGSERRNTLAVAQIQQSLLEDRISLATRVLPSLQCLHIIARTHMPLLESQVEGKLVSLLAKHVSVLTLQVKRISMPLDLPLLQHLVLHFDPFYHRWIWEENSGNETLLPSMGGLKALKTLYLQSNFNNNAAIRGTTDLTGCSHLQHVALQQIRLEGVLVLPDGCILHAFSEPLSLNNISPGFANSVTGLTVRHASEWTSVLELHHYDGLFRDAPAMPNLRRLRLILSKSNLNVLRGPRGLCGELQLAFCPEVLPALEVLEVDVPCNLIIDIDPRLQLRSVIVIAAGDLELTHFRLHGILPDDIVCYVPLNTLEQAYMKAGAALTPFQRQYLEMSYARELGAQMRFLEHNDGRQSGWTLQMPTSFHPGNLQECCCSACPECQAQAGVPILCDRAWTSDGFDEHLRHHCSEAF